MASSGHCKASDNPHFFKVVLATALNEQKLEIPKKFVRDHGPIAFLNNQICLEVADGREWNMELTKSNGRVWFDHGWQKFVEFYSIRFEYFLVFKYERQSSKFHVFIFDLTATEIEYPITKIYPDKAQEKVKMETGLDDHDPIFSPRVGEVSFGGTKSMNDGRKPPSTASQRARAMAKATTFQSMTSNPSFMCKICPTHIHPGKSLNVPISFGETHLEEQTQIILKVSDGRMWSTRSHFYRTRRMRKTTDFTTGWKKFARDNNLQVGDVCVFEMIRKNSRNVSFKVEIFRAL